MYGPQPTDLRPQQRLARVGGNKEHPPEIIQFVIQVRSHLLVRPCCDECSEHFILQKHIDYLKRTDGAPIEKSNVGQWIREAEAAYPSSESVTPQQFAQKLRILRQRVSAEVCMGTAAWLSVLRAMLGYSCLLLWWFVQQIFSILQRTGDATTIKGLHDDRRTDLLNNRDYVTKHLFLKERRRQNTIDLWLLYGTLILDYEQIWKKTHSGKKNGSGAAKHPMASRARKSQQTAVVAEGVRTRGHDRPGRQQASGHRSLQVRGAS